MRTRWKCPHDRIHTDAAWKTRHESHATPTIGIDGPRAGQTTGFGGGGRVRTLPPVLPARTSNGVITLSMSHLLFSLRECLKTHLAMVARASRLRFLGRSERPQAGRSRHHAISKHTLSNTLLPRCVVAARGVPTVSTVFVPQEKPLQRFASPLCPNHPAEAGCYGERRNYERHRRM